MDKDSPAMWETQVRTLCWEDPLENNNNEALQTFTVANGKITGKGEKILFLNHSVPNLVHIRVKGEISEKGYLVLN